MTSTSAFAAPADRAHAYLAQQNLVARGARIVPLTGDASDRHYFRVLVPEAQSFVLAVHSGPIDYATLPFVNVAELLMKMPVPIPSILGHDDALGILAVDDLGDVTLQAHLGAAPLADHAALYRQAVNLIAVMQKRGRNSPRRPMSPTGWPSTSRSSRGRWTSSSSTSSAPIGA